MFLSKFVLSYRGVLPSKEMRALWGRNHNTLRTNTGFRLRFPSHSPDPFCQSIKLFQPLAVAETHQVHLNTCELETPGNYSDFPLLENPRDGDWENCTVLWTKPFHRNILTVEVLLTSHGIHTSFYRFSVPSQCSERPWSQKQEITIYFYLIHSTGLLWKGFIAWLPKCRNYAELVSPEKQKPSGHF